jgi:hypothetical protein
LDNATTSQHPPFQTQSKFDHLIVGHSAYSPEPLTQIANCFLTPKGGTWSSYNLGWWNRNFLWNVSLAVWEIWGSLASAEVWTK